MSNVLKCLAIAVAVAVLLPAEPAAAQALPGEPQSTTMATDLASRSRDIHWPEGFDPATATVFAHDESRIEATCDRVWSHLIEAKAWPTWYSSVRRVKLMHTYSALLKQGTAFRWETAGRLVDSKVNEFVPSSRIGWYAHAPDTDAFYQTFLLTSDGEGCRIVTEEVGNGPVAWSLRQAAENPMHRAQGAWLASLKVVSER